MFKYVTTGTCCAEFNQDRFIETQEHSHSLQNVKNWKAKVLPTSFQQCKSIIIRMEISPFRWFFCNFTTRSLNRPYIFKWTEKLLNFIVILLPDVAGWFVYRLLDVLSGRTEPIGITGHILLNGQRRPKNFKCMTGYVVQVRSTEWYYFFRVPANFFSFGHVKNGIWQYCMMYFFYTVLIQRCSSSIHNTNYYMKLHCIQPQ